MGKDIRLLNADEIDARVATVTQKGCSLLLYKDARCDMRLLDETFGSMNWTRSHEVIDGNLYCNVSVWDEEKKIWITKQDVGTESYTEKEKGDFNALRRSKKAGPIHGAKRDNREMGTAWSDRYSKHEINKKTCHRNGWRSEITPYPMSKKKIIVGIISFFGMMVMMGIAGTLDYTETVVYNMPENIYLTIKEKVGDSDRKIAAEYVKNKETYDKIGYDTVRR